MLNRRFPESLPFVSVAFPPGRLGPFLSHSRQLLLPPRRAGVLGGPGAGCSVLGVESGSKGLGIFGLIPGPVFATIGLLGNQPFSLGFWKFSGKKGSLERMELEGNSRDLR